MRTSQRSWCRRAALKFVSVCRLLCLRFHSLKSAVLFCILSKFTISSHFKYNSSAAFSELMASMKAAVAVRKRASTLDSASVRRASSLSSRASRSTSERGSALATGAPRESRKISRVGFIKVKLASLYFSAKPDQRAQVAVGARAISLSRSLARVRKWDSLSAGWGAGSKRIRWWRSSARPRVRGETL